MEENNIRKHLRAALTEVIALEKTRLHQIYDESDAAIQQGVKKMVPIIHALNALKDKIGEVKGLKIDPAPHGHMATVWLENSVIDKHFTISTSVENYKYTVKTYSWFFKDDEPTEKEYEYDDASDALKLVIDAIGKYIASK